MSEKVILFPPDPKDIHDGLEMAGLDVMCWLLNESERSAAYRIIVRGAGSFDLVAMAGLIRSAFCEKVAIAINSLDNGQAIVTVRVYAPKSQDGVA